MFGDFDPFAVGDRTGVRKKAIASSGEKQLAIVRLGKTPEYLAACARFIRMPPGKRLELASQAWSEVAIVRQQCRDRGGARPQRRVPPGAARREPRASG